MRVRLSLSLCLVLLAAPSLPTHAQARPAAPAAHCLDARETREMHQSSDRTLAVLDRHGGRHRISLAQACPIDGGPATLEAPNGWVCGGGQADLLRTARGVCRVVQVRGIDAREFAALARRAAQAPGATTTLPTVEVTGTRPRGFGGTYAYCFPPEHMRAWSEDGDGLLVEMRPKRADGNRFYRVEFASSCPELGTAQQIAIRSGAGNGLVCGNAGDRVTNLRDPLVEQEFQGRLRGAAEAFGCPITAVYPVER